MIFIIIEFIGNIEEGPSLTDGGLKSGDELDPICIGVGSGVGSGDGIGETSVTSSLSAGNCNPLSLSL